MELYAVVIGRLPKNEPYVVYCGNGTTLAVFESRKIAIEYKKLRRLKNAHIEVFVQE